MKALVYIRENSPCDYPVLPIEISCRPNVGELFELPESYVVEFEKRIFASEDLIKAYSDYIDYHVFGGDPFLFINDTDCGDAPLFVDNVRHVFDKDEGMMVCLIGLSYSSREGLIYDYESPEGPAGRGIFTEEQINEIMNKYASCDEN